LEAAEELAELLGDLQDMNYGKWGLKEAYIHRLEEDRTAAGTAVAQIVGKNTAEGLEGSDTWAQSNHTSSSSPTMSLTLEIQGKMTMER
jgi:hypothetical protein